MSNISRVSDQNGVSRLYIVEIFHSGRPPRWPSGKASASRAVALR